MITIAEPYKTAYLGGAVPIIAFTEMQDRPPVVDGYYYRGTTVCTNDGLPDSTYSPYEALAPGKITQLSYETGCNGYGYGSAMTASLTLNVTRRLDNFVFAGNALWLGFHEAGEDWKDPYTVGLWTKIPEYFKEERPTMTQNRYVDLKAHGYLSKFDIPISTIPSTGTKTIKQELDALLPCKIPVYLAKLCELRGYAVADDGACLNSLLTIKTSPFGDSSENVTCRDVLDWLLVLTSCQMRPVPDGSGYKIKFFAFSPYNEVAIKNICTMDVRVIDAYISKVTVQDNDWAVKKSSTPSGIVESRELVIPANPLFNCLGSTSSRTAAANAIINRYLDKTLCEFDMTVAAGWQYEVGDYVSFKDAKNKTRRGWLTYVKHNMNGYTQLKCELAS